MIGFTLSNIYSRFLFINIKNENTLLSENFYLQILYENFSQLINFKFVNIFLIFTNEILIDRVLALFLCFYLFVFIFGNNKKLNILNLTIILNTILVFYLYISIWKNIELGSAIDTYFHS